jgi:hypothetical protein
MVRKNNDSFLITISLFISGFIVIYLYSRDTNDSNNNDNNDNNDNKKNDITIVNQMPKQRIPREDRYNQRSDGPGRDYYSRRINIRTRGEPSEYQTMGVLKKEGTDDVVPLIGRQTYPGSNQWNYFTMTDSHLKTEIPIKKERNCTEAMGCTEIQTDDTVNFLGNNYSVDMYPYNDIRYIPY